MKTLLYTSILIFLFQSCKEETTQLSNNSFFNSKKNSVFIVAHRGDWRNAPENSLQAIQNCIKLGIDMVEIDVRETKDGKLVLMHDQTIDRTTTGKGYVKDWTLDSLKTLFLLDGLGQPTTNKIPTLEEALNDTKGKILVNLDKSYNIFEKCYSILEKTETQNEVIIKGNKTFNEIQKEFGKYLNKVKFMPVLNISNPHINEIVDEYLKNSKPLAFEFIINSDTIQFIENFESIREKGVNIWVNALWSRLNDGHDDEKAYKNPSTYDWYLKNNINIIQTDRPKKLLTYLRNNNLHE